MSNSEIFLLGFTVFAAIGSIIVYNIDFTKWKDEHSHE